MLRFPAQVQNGVLQGEQQGGRGSAATTYRIEGPIRPDGTARLQASGVVVNPATANRNAGPNTPYRYAVDARFEGSSGTGRRIGARSCELAFVKR